jgi:hypothetical protein
MYAYFSPICATFFAYLMPLHQIILRILDKGNRLRDQHATTQCHARNICAHEPTANRESLGTWLCDRLTSFHPRHGNTVTFT